MNRASAGHDLNALEVAQFLWYWKENRRHEDRALLLGAYIIQDVMMMGFILAQK